MDSEPPRANYDGFWPIFFIGMSMVLLLVWEIQVGVSTRQNAEQMRTQQLRVVDQARKVEDELSKLVRGLVELAKTDDAAKGIVTKFGIKLNNPTVPTETPTPAP
jgi:hypothetical protein